MYSDTRFYKNVLEIRDMYRDAQCSHLLSVQLYILLVAHWG